MLSSLSILLFISYQVSRGQFNGFSFAFSVLTIIFIIIMIQASMLLEKDNIWKIKPLSSFFCSAIIALKTYLFILLISSEAANSFDDRLSVYNSSFLLGIDLAISVFIFPLIPLFANKKWIKKISIILWGANSIATLLLAPSKSYTVSIVFSILFYRFLKRKTGGGGRALGLISLKTLFIVSFTVTVFLYFLSFKLGDDYLSVLSHRLVMNFDIAIYASKIPNDIRPDHGTLFYAILPLLTKINGDFYLLEYYSIPQWVVGMVLNISRYGRYGYPNDNFLVGLLVSYNLLYVLIIYFIYLFLMYRYIKYISNLKQISAIQIYILISSCSFFFSAQDVMIKGYVILFIYFAIEILLFLPKRALNIQQPALLPVTFKIKTSR
jgi:hypothetical protein